MCPCLKSSAAENTFASMFETLQMNLFLRVAHALRLSEWRRRSDLERKKKLKWFARPERARYPISVEVPASRVSATCCLHLPESLVCLFYFYASTPGLANHEEFRHSYIRAAQIAPQNLKLQSVQSSCPHGLHWCQTETNNRIFQKEHFIPLFSGFTRISRNQSNMILSQVIAQKWLKREKRR